MAEAIAGHMLVAEKQTLATFKDRVSHIYKEAGDFIVTSTERMRDFRKMMTPYVKYFYPERPNAAESFITDVVEPSRQELDGTIDRAVGIMTGDMEMNEKVSRAIEDVLGLKQSIDNVLGLIDEIDIYSENMLILSTKYGEAGLSLTRISQEMVAMAGVVNGIGGRFCGLMERLEVTRGEFNIIRQKMEATSENYLTKMKVDLSIEFGNMLRELGDVSGLVHVILINSVEIELALKGFINNIQMEDIIRQKIEKILFYLERLGEGNGNGGARKDIDAVVLHVVSERLADLEKDVSSQYDEAHGFCDRISMLLNDVISRLHIRGDEDGAKETGGMDLIYNRIENLKDEYITFMEEIIFDKKRILNLCMVIRDILEMFDELFSRIADTGKRFEALNMVTRIELARHVKLYRTLGGTLRSIKILPAKMRKIVNESLGFYYETKNNIAGAVSQYAENFRLQDQVLAGCIASMKRVSVKLYESQKYYWDISQENERYCSKLLGFIDEHGTMSGLFEARETIRAIIEGVNVQKGLAPAGCGADIGPLVEMIRETAKGITDDPVLASLSHEFETDKSTDRVIIF
jgi:hypothetical protein